MASSIITVTQDLFIRRNLEVLGTFSPPFSPSVDLEPIEEPEDASLTDWPLRLVASLFWFVCAVLLLARGSLWACFPGVSSSTSSVVFFHSDTGKALDPVLASTGGRGVRKPGLEVCVEHSVAELSGAPGSLPKHVLLAHWELRSSSMLHLLSVPRLPSYSEESAERLGPSDLFFSVCFPGFSPSVPTDSI